MIRTYVYRCDSCRVNREAQRTVEERNDAPLCPFCVSPMRRFITGVQIVASPWYDKEGVSSDWPIGMSDKDKVASRKKWDAESDQSWNGKAPSKSDFAVPNVQDVYKNLTQDTVQKVLNSVEAAD